MSEVCERMIKKALDIAAELVKLADESEAAGDDGCAVLCGVIRDCGYTIRRCAERDAVRRGLLAGAPPWR